MLCVYYYSAATRTVEEEAVGKDERDLGLNDDDDDNNDGERFPVEADPDPTAPGMLLFLLAFIGESDGLTPDNPSLG